MNNLPRFPVTVVGSMPRSKTVSRALRDKQKGHITDAEFNAIADDAVIESLKTQEENGVDIVSDGEQRRDNFYSFITGCMDGIRLMTLAEMLDYVEDKAAFEQLLNALDVPAFALKNPVVDGKLKRTSPLVLQDYHIPKTTYNKTYQSYPTPDPTY